MNKITGYRDLTDNEIETINLIKKLAAQVGEVVDVMQEATESDKRWVAIAKTDLQKGFMALIRSVAKPETF